MPIYKVNDKTYNVPDNKAQAFEAKYPNATVRMAAGGKNYTIPLNTKKEFQNQYKDAAFAGPSEEYVAKQKAKEEKMRNLVELEDEEKKSLKNQIDKGYVNRADVTFVSKPKATTVNPLSPEELNLYVEEKDLDDRYTPKKVESENDVLENYINRFALTKNGQNILAQTGKTQDEIQEEFREGVFNRYGQQIQSDINAYNKEKNTSDVNALSTSIAGQLKEKKKELSAYAPSDARAALMQSASYNRNTAGLRKDISTLESAERLVNDAQNIIAEAKDPSSNFFQGVYRGTRDNLSWESWTFGLADMADSGKLLEALIKTEHGKELTQAETALVDASLLNMATHAYYDDKMGAGYKAGQVTAESLPFMLEFVANPISASGSTIAKRLLKYGMKKFGKETMKRSAAKFGARLAGDVAAATGMAFTTGLPRIIGGAQERIIQDYDYGRDAEGNLYAKGGDISVGEALGKSALSTIIENQSEMIFNAFRGAGDVLKKAGIVDLSLPKSGIINKISQSGAGRVLREIRNNPTIRKVAERTQFHGLPEEYMEEVYNNFASVAIGDMTVDEAIDLDRNIDTFIGLVPTSMAFGALGIAGLAKEQMANSYRRRKAFGKMTKEQQAKYAELEQMATQPGNEDIKQFIKYTIADETLTQDEKKAEIEYLFELVKSNAIQDMTPEATQQDANYDAGAEAEDKNKVKTEFEDAENKLKQKGYDVNTGDIEADAQTDADVAAYANAQAKMDGMLDKTQADIDAQVDEVERVSRSNLSNNGQLIEATTATGEKVFVKSGDITQLPDGSYSATGSIVISKEDGTSEFVDGKTLTITNVMDGQQYVDNAVTQTREALEQQAANEIDGRLNMNPGDVYGMQTENGVVPVTILGTDQAGNIITDIAGQQTVMQRGQLEAAVAEAKKPMLKQVEGGYMKRISEQDGIVSADVYDMAGNVVNTIEIPTQQYYAYPDYVAQAQAPAQTEVQPEVQPTQAEIQVSKESTEDRNGDTVGGSPVALSYLLEGGQGSIFSTGYFLHGVAAAFPKLTNEIEQIRSKYLTEINPTSTIYANSGHKSIEDIRNLIKSVYGDKGVDLFNTLLKNADGFVPRDGRLMERELELLQPISQESAENYTQREQQASEPQIPTDKDGNILYDQMEVEDAIGDIYNNQGLTEDEADQFVDANINQSEKDVKTIENKAPKMGTNMSKYKQDKAEWQNKLDEAKRKAEFWNNVREYRRQSKQQPTEAQIKDWLKNTEPMTGDEYAAMFLLSKRLTRDSYMRETGYGPEETKKMLGVFSTPEKGGISIERAAELMQEQASGEGYNFFGDSQDARNAIINVLGQVRTRGDLFNYIKNNRERIAKEQQQQEREYYDNKFMQEYGMSVDEYQAYEEQIYNEIKALPQDAYDEVMNEFADEMDNYYKTKEDGQRGIETTTETGGEVLQGEQPVDERGLGTTEGQTGSESAGEVEAAQERVEPVSTTAQEQIKQAEAEVNTTPTDAQKEAGNYKKGHVRIDGYDITIEQPKGSVRSGVDENGNRWETTMNNTYGYIRGTESVDGDHIDVFLSDNPEQGNVYVVDQINQQTGEFDEHKVMYGFGSMDEAKAAYLSNYSEGWKVGPITEVSKEEFKKWINSSKRKTKPFAEYASVKPIAGESGETVTPTEQNVSEETIKPSEKTAENESATSSGESKVSEIPERKEGESLLDYAERVAEQEENRIKAEKLPQALTEAYQSEDKEQIDNIRKQMQEYINSSEDADILQTTLDRAKENVKSAKKEGNEARQKMNEDVVSFVKSRLKDLAKQGIKPKAKEEQKEEPIDESKYELDDLEGEMLEAGADYAAAVEENKDVEEVKDKYRKAFEAYWDKTGLSKDEIESKWNNELTNYGNINQIPEQQESPTEKIEDVGEKIGGAKKDKVKEYSEKIKEIEGDSSDFISDIAKLPLSKIYNFDYKALREEGVSNEIISLLETIKKFIPSKPRTEYKLRRWANNVFSLYSMALRLIASDGTTQQEWVDKILSIEDLKRKYNAYMALGGFDANVNTADAMLLELDDSAGHYDKKGNWISSKGKWHLSNAGKYSGIYDTFEQAKEALQSFVGVNAEEKKQGKPIQFSIYKSLKDGSFFITPKSNSNVIIETFDNVEAARKYLKENYNDLVEKYKSIKESSKIGFLENQPRQGRDWRKGKNISADEFKNTFGFRGVEFGNWANQQDRQIALNSAYDAFMDLASAIGKSPKAISLNGELAMAFGARGGGKAMAHYEPSKIVINLTKTQGAGSLAHEWFHAIDNYFARQRGYKGGYNTEGTGYKFEYRGDISSRKPYRSSDKERQELTESFDALVKAINNSEYGKRSSAYSHLVQSKYWREPTELGARAFAKWIEIKLAQNDTRNDFLANNPSGWSSLEQTEKYYPYPFESDMESIGEAFDNLFNTIQEKVDAEGNVMLYRFIGERGAANLDAAEEVTTRLDNLQTARDMEQSGKDAKTIKLATGWERGADGLWRYETMDIEYFPNGDAGKNRIIERRSWGKEYLTLLDKLIEGETLTEEEQKRFDELDAMAQEVSKQYDNTEKIYLDDYVKDDELFKAYPELKQTKIVFVNESSKEAGSYSAKDNTITINLNSEIETKSILAHEIQHAIQRTEGFATGGNYKSVLMFFEENPNVEMKLVVDETYKEAKNRGIDITKDELYKMFTENDDVAQEIENEIIERNGITEGELGDIYNSGVDAGYKSIAGEVEARNVQSRLGMSMEERLGSLASETEDVAREDQIVLQDMANKAMSMQESRSEKTEQIASEATALSDKLNTPIRIANSLDELSESERAAVEEQHSQGRRVAGFYNPATDEVVVFMPDVKDIQDVKATVFHEIVGHKGLRELYGQEFNDFLLDVYTNANSEVRAEIAKRITANNWDAALATEEYLAELAEKGTDINLWDKIANLFRKFLRKIGLNVGVSVRELRYILRQSYNNRVNGGVFRDAQRVSDEYLMNTGRFSDMSAEEQDIIDHSKADGTYMLAPNGQPTNLTEKQWAQVRTQAFKDWFGDWENDPENASKVVDENGEPLVVYHGTPLSRKQLTPNRGWQKDGTTYISQEAPFTEFRGGEYSGLIFTSVDYEKARSIAEKRAMNIPDDEQGNEQWTDEGYVYDLFLNIRNPFDPKDKELVRSVLNTFGKDIPTLSFYGGKGENVSLEEAVKIASGEKNSWLITETPEFLEKIKQDGYDGLVGYDEWVKYIAATDPSQIKSATDNIGTFSAENEDIRYMSEYNSGYSQRDNDTNASVRAIKAETEGSYSAGNFKKKYGVSKKDFDVLADLNAIVQNEWHHTGVNFRKTDFYSWADSSRAGGKVNYTDAVPEGSMADRYKKNKKEISKLSNEYENLDWEYRDMERIPSLEMFAEEVAQLTEEEKQARDKEHKDISDKSDVLTPYERREEHYAVDVKYRNIERSRAEKLLTENRDDLIKQYEERYKKQRQQNAETEKYNSESQGKESVLIKIGKLLGLDENSLKSQVSIRSQMKRREAEISRLDDLYEQKRAEVEQEIENFVDGLIKDNKAVARTRIKERPEMFIEQNREMKGRYGWFKSSGSYRLPEYYSGVEFLNKEDYDKYLSLKRKQRKIEDDKLRNINSNIRFRAVPTTPQSVAQEYYNEGILGTTELKYIKIFNKEFLTPSLARSMANLEESWFDYMRSVRVLQEAIEKETGEKIKDSENVYLRENANSSVNKIELEMLEKEKVEPLMETLRDISDEELDGEYITQRDIEQYLNSVHGLERNEKMYNDNLNDPNYKGDPRRDYSGLTAIYETDDVEAAEDEARKYIQKFEDAVGKDLVDELWKNIKAITDYTIEKEYKSGIISKEVYDKIKGMYNNYVPLRGFDDTTAGDVYNYFMHNDYVLQSTVKTAKGRRSRAADIIGNILNMMQSSVIRSNKNSVKQCLLNLAISKPTKLLTVGKQWYEKSQSGDIVPVLPPVTDAMTEDERREAIEKFEEDMQQKAKNKEVFLKNASFDAGLRTDKYQKMEHAVKVYRNGREFVVYVNASPRAAQAINGLLNEDNRKGLFRRFIGACNRWLASVFTSYNPEFIYTNFIGDVLTSNMTTLAVEGLPYTKKFNKNLKDNISLVAIRGAKKGRYTGIFSLYRKFKKGTLDLTNERERYFDEFLKNGGETGYTQMLSIDDYNKIVRKEMEGDKNYVKIIMDGLEFINRGVENACRFAAYMTSRQAGRSITESIRDAKEVSVNFNRKGSGAMWNKYMRDLYIFLNSSLQSIFKFAKLIKKYPKSMKGILFGIITIGFLNGIINGIIGADDDGDEFGNDFYNLTPYTRRSNFLVNAGRYVKNIPMPEWMKATIAGDEKYISLPLPHEIRAFYGIGQIAAGYIQGYDKYENTASAIVTQLSNIMPIDFVNSEGLIKYDDSFIDGVIRGFTPTVLGYIADAYWWNKDYSGRPITNQQDWNRKAPEYLRASKSTPAFYTSISKWLNMALGGEEFRRSKYESKYLNPSAIEYLINTAFGGPATFVNKSIKTFEMVFGDEDFNVYNVPFLNKVVKSSNDDYARSRNVTAGYWYYMSEYDLINYEISQLGKSDDALYVEERIAEMEENGDMRKWEILKDAKSEIRKVNNAIKATNDKDKLKKLYNEKIDIMQEAIEQIEDRSLTNKSVEP